MPAELTNPQEQEMKINTPESTGAELELFSSEDLEKFTEETVRYIGDGANGTLNEGREFYKNSNRSIGLSESETEIVAQETGADTQFKSVQEEIVRLSQDATDEITAAAGGKNKEVQDSKEITENEVLIKSEQVYLSEKKASIIEKGEKDLKEDPRALDKANKKAEALGDRYDDEKTGADYTQKQIGEFAEKSGLSREVSAELADKKFNTETKKLVFDKAKEHIDRLLLSKEKEKGRFNPEKHKTVSEQAERYLNLIEQAKNEGDLPPDLDAQTVLDMVRENIWTMAYQDRVASENMLGDHGIRHIVGYNIKITEKLFSELENNGQKTKAVDKLMAHQIMIMHDLGYATEPVRAGVNAGNFAADTGHNLLSAKILRQRGEDENDAISKMFSKEQLAIMHQGVLEHDNSKVDFRVGDDSAEARKENLFSAIHLADNTHAFEDKLPELLYSSSNSLKTMRLLKTAGEIGDETLVKQLKQQLINQIKEDPDYSDDDIDALEKAANSLSGKSYERSVGRICGNKPEFTIDPTGAVKIKVQESAIHQEAMKLFGEKAYDQLRKFIADLKGIEKEEVTEEMLSKQEIDGKGKRVKIVLSIKEGRAADRSDYQNRIEALVHDREFRDHSDEDHKFSTIQKDIEAAIKKAEIGEESLEELANAYRAEGDMRPAQEIVQEKLKAVKEVRRNLFNAHF